MPRHKRSFTKKEIKQIISLHTKKFKSINQIKCQFKAGRITIMKIFKNNNVVIKNYRETCISEQDKLNIINDYIILKINLLIVASKYHITPAKLRFILRKNGYDIRNSGETRKITLEKAEIEKAYKIYKRYGSLKLTSKYMNIRLDILKRNFEQNGIDTSIKGKSNVSLEKWEFEYGKEKANEMWNEYTNKLSISSGGINNPMYGKPSPNGSGQGWKGHYKNFYFRSLRELSYLLYLDKNDIKWETAESKRFMIKYKSYDETDRTYRPDFYLPELNKLVEIKPKRLHKSPLILLKTAAALEFCKDNNLTYEIFDFPIDTLKIKKALDEGKIKFSKDYQKKFLEFISQ